MLRVITRRLDITDHRVDCPIRGRRDVERCLICPFLRNLRLKDPNPSILCRAPVDRSPLEIFSLLSVE